MTAGVSPTKTSLGAARPNAAGGPGARQLTGGGAGTAALQRNVRLIRTSSSGAAACMPCCSTNCTGSVRIVGQVLACDRDSLVKTTGLSCTIRANQVKLISPSAARPARRACRAAGRHSPSRRASLRRGPHRHHASPVLVPTKNPYRGREWPTAVPTSHATMTTVLCAMTK